MKKKFIVIVVLLLSTYFNFAEDVYKYIDTACEAELLAKAGITNATSATFPDWYFYSGGIDQTAKKMVDQLPSDKPVVLYGISLGGTVARRMTQVAAERGKNVKGYIAQSSPLSGDRLTNRTWATASLAMLGAYTYVCGSASICTFFGNLLLGGRGLESNYNCINELEGASKQLVDIVRTVSTDKSIMRSDNEAIVNNVTLPLIYAALGDNRDSLSDAGNYFSSVFISNSNNVKDLDPTGNFMNNVMNAPSEIQKETKSNIRRVFLVSTNGNIYESSLWSSIGPIYNSLRNDRDGYRTNARNQWWAFAYWEIKAALLDVSIASLDNLPGVWSFCVSGSNDCSTNDGFVPAIDTFNGKKIGMTASGNLRDSYDKRIDLPNTSHIDYIDKTLSSLSSKQGRSGSRKQSTIDQENAIKDSVKFFN